jgi:hypothetical protein
VEEVAERELEGTHDGDEQHELEAKELVQMRNIRLKARGSVSDVVGPAPLGLGRPASAHTIKKVYETFSYFLCGSR